VIAFKIVRDVEPTAPATDVKIKRELNPLNRDWHYLNSMTTVEILDLLFIIEVGNRCLGDMIV
jgi:hypothetical protein